MLIKVSHFHFFYVLFDILTGAITASFSFPKDFIVVGIARSRTFPKDFPQDIEYDNCLALQLEWSSLNLGTPASSIQPTKLKLSLPLRKESYLFLIVDYYFPLMS